MTHAVHPQIAFGDTAPNGKVDVLGDVADAFGQPLRVQFRHHDAHNLPLVIHDGSARIAGLHGGGDLHSDGIAAQARHRRNRAARYVQPAQ